MPVAVALVGGYKFFIFDIVSGICMTLLPLAPAVIGYCGIVASVGVAAVVAVAAVSCVT